MFRYAIFDFDGTLADTGAGVFASVQYALRSMGEPELDSETLKYFIGPPLETSFSVKCGLDSERCHEAVEKYREYYSTKGIYELEFFPSTLSTLRELKAAGVKTAVGSSKPELFINRILEHFGISDLFDFVSGATFGEPHADKTVIISARSTGSEWRISRMPLWSGTGALISTARTASGSNASACSRAVTVTRMNSKRQEQTG